MRSFDGIGLATLLGMAGFLLSSCESSELLKKQDSAGFNGGFETAVDGIPVNWAFFPNPEFDSTLQVTVESGNAFEGNRSLRVVVRQGEMLPGFRSRRLPVRAGENYRLSISLRNEGCSIKVNRIVQDASGMTVLRRDFIVDTSADFPEWATFDETLAVSEGEAQVLLIFLIEGSGTMWFDGVKLEEMEE